MAYRWSSPASASFMKREPAGVWSVPLRPAATERFGGVGSTGCFCPGAGWASTVQPRHPQPRLQESPGICTVEKSKNPRAKPWNAWLPPSFPAKTKCHCFTPLPHSRDQRLLYGRPSPLETAQPLQEAPQSWKINGQRPCIRPPLRRPCGQGQTLRDFRHALARRAVTGARDSELLPKLCQKSRDGSPVPS